MTSLEHEKPRFDFATIDPKEEVETPRYKFEKYFDENDNENT